MQQSQVIRVSHILNCMCITVPKFLSHQHLTTTIDYCSLGYAKLLCEDSPQKVRRTDTMVTQAEDFAMQKFAVHRP